MPGGILHSGTGSTTRGAARIELLEQCRSLSSTSWGMTISWNFSRVPRDQSIHGRRLQLGQWTFVGYQYSLPFMGGPFEKPEASIHLDVVALEGLLDADTIFVSHSPALGILDSGIADTQIGSSSLRDLLQRNPVRAHIHGHSHSDFGRQGLHFNVASAGRERAILLDLETMEHQIVQRSPS